MKLGLLSFHNAANYGAGLQAYALQKFIETQGYECEYLDYQNEHRRGTYDMNYQIKNELKRKNFVGAMKLILGKPLLEARDKKFKEFYKQYVKYSAKTYYSPEELRSVNGSYDKFIVGSDQVWNPKNNGKDVTYLLDFVEDKGKTISYSSSFGILEVPEFIREDYVRCFNQIKHLASREASGIKLIKSLTGRDAKLVLDPVFLVTKEQWRSIIEKDYKDEKFIFSYTNRDSQYKKFIKTTGYSLDGRKNYKLSRYTSPVDFLNPSVRVKYFMSPTEFLHCVNDSELVVSASFHCISMSIILNTPFVCFLTGDEGKDERLKTLLTHFGLMNRVYSKEMTLEDVNKPIDWDHVNKVLEEKRHDSMEYLLKAIEG